MKKLNRKTLIEYLISVTLTAPVVYVYIQYGLVASIIALVAVCAAMPMAFLAIIVIGYLVITLVMVRFNKSLAMRLRHGLIQTGIVTYTHPQTGQRIVSVSTTHVGRPEYYKALYGRINQLEQSGFVILYEQIQAQDSERMDPAKVHEHSSESQFEQEFFHRLGLMPQIERDIPKSWVNTDISQEDYERWEEAHLSQNELKELESVEKGLTSILPYLNRMPLSVLRWLIKATFRLEAAYPQWDRFIKSPDDALILTHRNEIGSTAVQSHLPRSGKVATVWGAGHWDGLHSVFIDWGFEVTSSDWLTVM